MGKTEKKNAGDIMVAGILDLCMNSDIDSVWAETDELKDAAALGGAVRQGDFDRFAIADRGDGGDVPFPQLQQQAEGEGEFALKHHGGFANRKDLLQIFVHKGIDLIIRGVRADERKGDIQDRTKQERGLSLLFAPLSAWMVGKVDQCHKDPLLYLPFFAASIIHLNRPGNNTL